MVSYLQKVYKSRYFWWHLAMADIRLKYRRSYLGLLWSIIQPLALTLLLTFVMGKVFKVKMKDYAPFIFSGMIIWEYVVSCAVTGCQAFVNAEGYIKQFVHPFAIYTLRNCIAGFINMLLAFLGLLLWVLIVKPENFGLSWLSMILSLPALLILAWPLGTICAFIGLRFRDFSQLIVIILQALWYVSPIFFLPSMFERAGLSRLVQFNPVFHVLNIVRAPLLRGEFPSLTSYLWVCVTILVTYTIMGLFIKTQEKKAIFYL